VEIRSDVQWAGEGGEYCKQIEGARMLIYVLIFFILIAIFMFIHKVVMKGRMERELGRKVQDRELTSISAWMETPSRTAKDSTTEVGSGHE
jgi:hypothetical protein